MSGAGSIAPIVLSSAPAAPSTRKGTTIAELTDGLQGRIGSGKIPSLFHAVNVATTMIAKRLYLLESTLAQGELYAPFFASREYTAETISFIPAPEGGQATIIDVLSGFIDAGFMSGMAIEAVGGGNDRRVMLISSVEAGVITLADGYNVSPFSAGTECVIRSRPDIVFLPDDFWGMVDSPKVFGRRGDMLAPVPNKYAEMHYEDRLGPLQYYKLYDGYLRLFPGAAADGTLTGAYFRKPVPVKTMDDVIPYNGLFDDVITEYAIAALAGGAPASAAAAESIVGRSVDLIVQKMGRKAPIRQTGGIDWEAMHE